MRVLAYAGDVCQADVDVEQPEVRALVASDLVVPAVAVGMGRLLVGLISHLEEEEPESPPSPRLLRPPREQDLLSSRICSSDAVVISPLLCFSNTFSHSSRRV